MSELRLGPFRLFAPVGRGGMGTVWRGEHVGQSVPFPVAVKVLATETARDPEAVERFRREVRAVARLSHPSIVVVLDHGVVPESVAAASDGAFAAGSPYLVMELADYTLSPPRSWTEIERVLVAVLEGLAHAHAHGVIHRDIKRGNVLVFRDGERETFKLADFGLAHAIDGEAPVEAQGTFVGTPQFMAPEQVTGSWRDQGPATDLYAVGCLAFRLACGQPPFRGTVEEVLAAHVLHEPPPLSPTVAVPEGFEEWVRWLLAKPLWERCGHAAHALAALRSLGAGRRDRRPPPLPKFDDVARDEAAPPMSLVGAGLGLYGLRPVPFVGRGVERRVLWEMLDEVARAGRQKRVLLHGAAGTGKSRLVEWLAHASAECGGATTIKVVHGPIPSPNPVGAALLAHLRCGGLPRASMLERIVTLLSDEGIEVPGDEEEAAAIVEAIATVPNEDARVRFANPRERHVVVARLLDRLSRRSPIVLWLDDVQWGADALALSTVLAEIAAARVLVVMTARDELLAERPLESALIDEMERSEEGLRRVAVGPLPKSEHRALVHRLIGLEGKLAADVATRTDGNPLFAVQLVGEWVQRGALVASQDGFRVAPAEKAIIPDDIQKLWVSRIDRLLSDEGLGDDARRSLELAGALGVDVDGVEWAEACAAARIPAPVGLVDAMIARRLAVGDASAWSFCHGMLRETLERQARESGRAADLHRACASMLRARHGGATSETAERLARHLVLAGDLEPAVDALLTAASARCDANDFSQAHALFAERARLLERLGVSRDDERWARAWALEGLAWSQQAGIDDGLRVTTAAADWARRHERVDLLAHAERTLAVLEHKRAHYEDALAYAEAAVAHALAAGDEPLAARARNKLADLHMARGDFELAEKEYRESMAVSDRHADLMGQATTRVLLGSMLQQHARRDEAAPLFAEAMSLFQRVGARAYVALCKVFLGEGERFRGELDAAEAHYREALRLQEMIGTGDAALTRINLALTQMERGSFADARTELDVTRAELEASGQEVYLDAVHVALATCAAAAGDWPAWDEHLREGEARLSASGSVHVDQAWTAEAGADIALRAGERERARRGYELALRQWRALGNDERAARVVATLAAL